MYFWCFGENMMLDNHISFQLRCIDHCLMVYKYAYIICISRFVTFCCLSWRGGLKR